MTDPIILPGGGYGGSRPTIPDHVRDTVADLAREGMSCREIAARVGIHFTTVARIAGAAGVVFDTEQTAQATRVRQERLRAKRATLLEEAHTTATMANALYQEQMIKDPTDHRGRAEAARAFRDAMAGYFDLAKIDQSNEADAIMIATDWMDGTMGPEIERMAEQYQRDMAEGRRDALDQLKAAGVPIPAELAERLATLPEIEQAPTPTGLPPFGVVGSRGTSLEVDQGPRVRTTQDPPAQDHPHAGDPSTLGRTREDPS